MTFYRVIKRLFDIASSLLALVVLSPLFLVIVLGVRLSSKGPVFYRTERAGKDGAPFTLYKFRSMHEYRPTEPGKTNEGGFIANEDRVFPFGRLLRRSKLDELPQLLNILAGHMSVVGPRPLTTAGAKIHYTGAYARILAVRPGLACLDSLFDYAHGELFVSDNDQYRAEVLPVRTELAGMYADRQSVGLDLYCIFRTPALMFRIAVLKQKTFPYTKYEREARQAVFGVGAEK